MSEPVSESLGAVAKREVEAAPEDETHGADRSTENGADEASGGYGATRGAHAEALATSARGEWVGHGEAVGVGRGIA